MRPLLTPLNVREIRTYRIVAIAAFLCLSFLNTSFGQVYVEDFNDEADDAVSGTAVGGTWSSTCTGCPANSFAKQTVAGDEYFVAGDNLDNEGVWTSNVINISSFSDVAVYIETATLFTEGGDYMNVYYNLDGAGEVLFHSQTTGSTTSNGLSPTLNGSTLQIVVRAFNNGVFDYFSFDNVAITNTLFSRNTPAVWGTSGTWSAIAINGATCACTPTAFTRVVVGGGHTVSIGAAATTANLQINGTADALGAGTLTWSGNFDLNIDQGGSVTVNSGGQINGAGNADSRITFTDDVAHSIVNNGTISIGDITVTGPGFPDFGTLTLNISGSGTLTVTDDIISNTSLIAPQINNNHTGTFTIGGSVTLTSGTFTNNNTITMSNTGAAALSGAAGTWTQGTNSILNYQGSTLTVNTLAATASGNTINYNAAGAQTMNPTSYFNLALSGSGAKSPGGNINVAGNWTVSGTATFTEGTNTVTLNGSGTTIQTISNASGETFYRLTVNNTSSNAIVFSNAITVTNTLDMTSGIVNLSGTTFTLGSGAGADLNRTASTTTKWMYGGSFRRYWPAGGISSTAGNLYGLFPLGTSAASSYRPFAATSTANTTGAGSVTVTHTDASTVTDLSPVFNDGGTNIVRKHDSQFVSSNSGVVGGTFGLNVTMTGLSAGTLSNIRLAVSNGATTVTTVGTHAAATGSAPNPTARRTGIALANLFGDFRITSTDLTATPLPIELISFQGEVFEGAVKLIWETASELNNDFFTVERSIGGEVFSSIGKVNGAGTTSQGKTYSLIDHNPIYGTGYYRLKQTDFDGTFTYSKIIDVTYEGSSIPVMDVFPNPTAGDQLNIKISGLKDIESVPVVMYDQMGRECMRLLLIVDKSSGTASKTFAPQQHLTQGVYVLKAGASPMLTKRFVVTSK